VTGAALGNKVIEGELKAAAIEVRNGKPLSEPISRSKHFPAIVAQMLIVGEETGQIDTVLTKIADFYEEEVSGTDRRAGGHHRTDYDCRPRGRRRTDCRLSYGAYRQPLQEH